MNQKTHGNSCTSVLSVQHSPHIMEETEYIHDNDSRAIPFPEIQEALDFLPRANKLRVMFKMAFLTGCRLSELNNMKTRHIQDGFIYWRLGKSQTGYRKEKLPADFLAELTEYRANNRTYQSTIFHLNHNTFRRMFNRDVRPYLSKAWQEKRLRVRANQLVPEHILQLNGLRKTFQTYLFYHEYQKHNDAGVALELTSKRMKHSSKHMTAYHYIQNFEALQIEAYGLDLPIYEILEAGQQMRIPDYIF
jgi:integrase